MIKQQMLAVKTFRLSVGNLFKSQFSKNKKAPAKMQVPAYFTAESPYAHPNT